MAFIPATNVVQAELIYNCEGQVMENVLHYQRGGGWTTTQMGLLGTFLIDWFNVNGKSMFANELSLVNVKMTDLTTETSPVIETAPASPIIGTWTGGVAPANVAVCCSKKTASRGRSYRGRTYLPGMPDSQVAGSYITSAHLSIITGKMALLLSTSIDSVTVPLVVVSRYHDGAPRAQAVVTPVSFWQINTRVDSQRRRLPGVGA